MISRVQTSTTFSESVIGFYCKVNYVNIYRRNGIFIIFLNTYLFYRIHCWRNTCIIFFTRVNIQKLIFIHPLAYQENNNIFICHHRCAELIHCIPIFQRSKNSIQSLLFLHFFLNHGLTASSD